jgi:hypothetical protein
MFGRGFPFFTSNMRGGYEDDDSIEYKIRNAFFKKIFN